MRAFLFALGLIIVSSASITTAQPAAAPEGQPAPAPWPNTFRDVAFGSSKAEAERILGKMKCSAMSSRPEAERCSTTDKAHAFRVDGEVVKTYYFFHRDRFLRVEFSQDEPLMYRGAATKNLSGPIVPSFSEKYGKPTVFSKEDYIAFSWRSEAMSAVVIVGIAEFPQQFGKGMDKAQYLRSATISTKEWDEGGAASERRKVDF